MVNDTLKSNPFMSGLEIERKFLVHKRMDWSVLQVAVVTYNRAILRLLTLSEYVFEMTKAT